MMSLNDRMMLECPEDYNEMADQLDAAEEEEAEEAGSQTGGGGGLDGGVGQHNGEDSGGAEQDLVILEDKKPAAYDDSEDLEDLEESLQALERLDRSSPDLWPDHIPGVGQFLPQTPFMDSDTPRGSEAGGYLHNLTREELETLMQLGGLSVQQLVCEVKRLQNVAYQLGQEESKEMTRGKYLNILKKKNNTS